MENNYYNDIERITVYVSKTLLKEAAFKSGLNNSKTVEKLLLEYISLDGDIVDLERKLKESDKIIKEEERKKKQVEQEIERLKAEQISNAQNAIIINECLERIGYYYSKNGYVTVSFLKRLSKIKRVEFSKLNDLCLQKEYNIIDA